MTITTFVGALAFGVLFVVISRRMRIPAIVLLLLGGIAVGPDMLGIIHPESLGKGLQTIVALAVALILFEGGLTLEIRGYREVSSEIKGVLTAGVLITWLLSSLIVRSLFHFQWDFSLLAGSLIIVTGPTVIGPLLRATRVRTNLHHILHWEGVLIDPIGVFIALLCYEWISSGGDHAMAQFLSRFAVGAVVGLLGGAAIALIIRKKWIPTENLNIFVLASALALFAVSDLLVYESGLLTVTIAGLVVGYLGKEQMETVKLYKAELIELLVGLLFVLLAANLEMSAFLRHGNLIVMAVLAVMFLVRPLNIFLSTAGTSLTLREKLFLSWVAPRGIVAASMASLFAITLQDRSMEDSSFLETFTYSVIAGTVLFQGLSTRVIGRLLGVVQPRATGWLIVGAHALGRRIAQFLQDQGVYVVLMDTNGRLISLSRREELAAICQNALTVDAEEYPELYGIGNVLAITRNKDLNTLVCQRWKKLVPDARLFRWGSLTTEEDNQQQGLMVGTPVWQALDPDSIPDVEQKEDAFYTLQRNVNVERIQHPERVLIAATGEEIQIQVPSEGAEEWALLRYNPFPLTLDVQTRPNWVHISEAASMSDVLDDLLGHLHDDLPRLDTRKLHKQLLAQEEEYSSVIGYDVALPHTYTEELSESVVLVARLAHPVECQNTGQSIAAIFLVLSPTEQAQEHLRALAEISKFIMNEENRMKLMQAQTEDELHELFFIRSSA